MNSRYKDRCSSATCLCMENVILCCEIRLFQLRYKSLCEVYEGLNLENRIRSLPSNIRVLLQLSALRFEVLTAMKMAIFRRFIRHIDKYSVISQKLEIVCFSETLVSAYKSTTASQPRRTLQPWRRRQYVSPKRWYLPTSLHGRTLTKYWYSPSSVHDLITQNNTSALKMETVFFSETLSACESTR
jgi:hypothetical protein